jgi:Flp pilus assembly protein TadD
MFRTSQETNTSLGIRILGGIVQSIILSALFFIPLFFLPFTREVLNTPKTIILIVGTLLGLFFWCWQVTLQKSITIRIISSQPFFLFFLVSILLSAVFSTIPSISFFGKTSVFVHSITFLYTAVAFAWLLLQVITTKILWTRATNLLLTSGTIAALIFTFNSLPVISRILPDTVTNLTSQQITVFAVILSALAALSLGRIMHRGTDTFSLILAWISGIVLTLTVFHIGFTSGMITLLVGMIATVIIGMRLVDIHRSFALSIAFGLFLASLGTLFFGTPTFIRAETPTEISLGWRPSVHIATEAITGSVKQFILGSGVGTFSYAFSLYKPISYNVNNPIWNIRMEHAWSTPIELLTELGIFGIITFFLLLCVLLGTCISYIFQKQSTFSKEELQERQIDASFVFPFFSAIIALTVGMFIVSFDTTAWWLWFVLIALSYVGMSLQTNDHTKIASRNISVSPEYSIALSFALLLLLSTMMMVCVFGVKMYRAEAAYTKAIQTNTLSDARTYNEQATTLRPTYPPYLISLASVYMTSAIEMSSSSSTASEALTYISNALNIAKRATELWNKDVSTWETIGTIYQTTIPITDEATTWAIDAYQKALALDPNNPSLHWRLGIIYAQQKNFEEAKKSFKKATEVKSDFIQAYIDLSTVLEQEKKTDDAIALFQPIFPLIQNNPDVLFVLGRLFYNREGEGDIDRAIELWQRATVLAPEYSNALFALGLAYEKKGETSQAVVLFRKVRELNPDNPDIAQKINTLIAPATPIGPVLTE